jgi:uncharacterized iron-regulated membrane protein
MGDAAASTDETKRLDASIQSSISATNTPIHSGLSTAIVIAISFLVAVIVALLIGTFLYWQHRRRLIRERETINNPHKLRRPFYCWRCEIPADTGH